MLIVELTALPNGAHRNQSCERAVPVPDGWARVAPEAEADAQQYLPFVCLTVTDGIITAVSDNAKARAEAQAVEQIAAEQRIAAQRVAELKDKLRETDYQAIKYAEGWITAAEYEPIKTQRQAWRDEINTIETADQTQRNTM